MQPIEEILKAQTVGGAKKVILVTGTPPLLPSRLLHPSLFPPHSYPNTNFFPFFSFSSSFLFGELKMEKCQTRAI